MNRMSIHAYVNGWVEQWVKSIYWCGIEQWIATIQASRNAQVEYEGWIVGKCMSRRFQ